MKRIILSILFLSVAAPVHAVSLCNAGLGLPCLVDAGNVLAGGVVVPAAGNDSESLVEAALESATGIFKDLTLYGKSDDNPELFTFSNFDEGTELEESKSGNWLVKDGTAIDYITIKGATSFLLYAANGLSSGVYSSLGILNNGGKQPEVSHISFWTSSTPTTDVPEPATALLLGTAGLLSSRRLRKLKNQ